MKVLLIPPIHGYRNFPQLLSFSDFPSGFAYVAASLEQAGHQVFGLQLNNKVGYSSGIEVIKDRVPKAISKVKPDLIGLGGICTDYHFLRDAIMVIRECCKVPIVLGGRIITQDSEIFEILKPDYGIVGEGEEAIVNLCNFIQAHTPEFVSPDGKFSYSVSTVDGSRGFKGTVLDSLKAGWDINSIKNLWYWSGE